MPKRNSRKPSDLMVLDRIYSGNRIYECRYTRCGKPNCSVCNPGEFNPDRPIGHGPYWYLCARHGKRWRRLYIGKELDTTKHIGPDGEIIFPPRRPRPSRAPIASQDTLPGGLPVGPPPDASPRAWPPPDDDIRTPQATQQRLDDGFIAPSSPVLHSPDHVARLLAEGKCFSGLVSSSTEKDKI